MTTVRTLVTAHRLEVERIKGSRFVGDAAPATTEAEALAIVDAVRADFPDASHHCWAFRLEDGRERQSDDGEPAGSAGPPILRRIGGAELSDVVVVVTRWFGGTKLGTGGLVRAYGGTAAAVLAAAPIEEREVLEVLLVEHDWDLTAAIEGVLAEYGARTTEATYGEQVRLQVAVAREAAEAFIRSVGEATSGRVLPRRGA